MIPNFEALGLIADVALGIVGFSAVLIGLKRSTDRFSEPDKFRVQLLSFSGFGALFAALLPFAAFDIHDSTLSWQVVTAALLIYASAGLTIFPQRMLKLRAAGYADLFRTHIFTFQTGILVLVFLLSLLMMIGAIEALATCYTACLLLYLLQSSVAFFRTMFVRVRP